MMLLDAQIAEIPPNFRTIDAGLRDHLQAHECLWAGRAATALIVAYQMAVARRSMVTQPEVIMPAMMCATAANTALIAGVTPRFADVDPHTGLISLETVQARYNANTVAVVAIHLLGQTVNMAPLRAWCDRHDILLIEDPTQALTAVYPDGNVAGSLGHVTVYSFNRTKIIDRGNGVLTANTAQAADSLRAIADTLTPFTVADDNHRLQLALSYRNLHHALVGLLRVHPNQTAAVSPAFLAVRDQYASLFLRAADPTVDLNSAWEMLPQALEHRLELARLYAHALKDGAWHLLTGYESSGVCWRFSLLIDDPQQQVAFSEAVRRDGFHVSNLYWPVDQFFNPADDCPNADYFARRIVNLWVDQMVDADYVARCCASLWRHAEALEIGV